jgi:phage baseplate assembly protein W
MPYGFSAKLPLTYDSDDGPYSLLKTIKEMGQQNLKMLVLTNPGERIMDANFGVGISRYLFEQDGAFTGSDLENKILEQVGIYLPYITITDIAIFPRSEENAASAQITYFIDGFTTNEELFLNLENDSVIRGN